MRWTLIEDTMAPARRWQARLSTDSRTTGWLPVGFLREFTIQAEGYFGGGFVQVSGTDSDETAVPMELFRHTDRRRLMPALLFRADLEEGDEHTDVLLTLVGRP